jgi:hypothetical protein
VDPRDAARQRRESAVAARDADAPPLQAAQHAADEPVPSQRQHKQPDRAPEDASGAPSGDWTSWAVDSLAAAVAGGLAAVTAAADDAAAIALDEETGLFGTPKAKRTPASSPFGSPSPSRAPSPSGWMDSFMPAVELEDGAQLRRGLRPPDNGDADGSPAAEDASLAISAAVWNPWRSCGSAPPVLRDS